MYHRLSVRTTLAAALLALAVAAPAAFAAKGGNGKGGNAATDPTNTLQWVMVKDQNGDHQPNWNDQVTFEVRTDATDKPWVLLNCYQSGTWVSTASHGLFPSYPYPNFTLASTAWTGGAATCVATLYMVTSNGAARDLASLTFEVSE